MDSTWETQSPNHMRVTTQLHHSNERYEDETPFPYKMEFNPNEIPHRLNTLHGSPSYRMEIQDKTRSFQSDFQNRMPLHVLHYPIGSKSDIQFHGSAIYQGISATHCKIPLICPGNTPGVTSLYPRKPQTRMSPCEVGIQSDSNRANQPSSTNEIPFYQTDNPRELYPDNFPGGMSLNPREVQKRMIPYSVGIQSTSDKAHQSYQVCSTNGVPSCQTGNPSEIHPDNIPRVTSLEPREAHLRIPLCEVAIRSDSSKVSQLFQGSSTKGIPFYQTDNPREFYPDNIPRETSLDPREVQESMPPYLVGIQSDSDDAPQFQQASSTYRIPSYRMDNPREMHRDQTINTEEMQIRAPCAESETLSCQTSRLQKGISLCEADFHEGVLTQQDDARTDEGMKASNPGTNANRRTSPAPHQPVTTEQTSHNLSSAQACPRCHCLGTTQPQPSYLPSLNLQNAHARPSVIMVPLKRKVKSNTNSQQVH